MASGVCSFLHTRVHHLCTCTHTHTCSRAHPHPPIPTQFLSHIQFHSAHEFGPVHTYITQPPLPPAPPLTYTQIKRGCSLQHRGSSFQLRAGHTCCHSFCLCQTHAGPMKMCSLWNVFSIECVLYRICWPSRLPLPNSCRSFAPSPPPVCVCTHTRTHTHHHHMAERRRISSHSFVATIYITHLTRLPVSYITQLWQHAGVLAPTRNHYPPLMLPRHYIITQLMRLLLLYFTQLWQNGSAPTLSQSLHAADDEDCALQTPRQGLHVCVCVCTVCVYIHACKCTQHWIFVFPFANCSYHGRLSYITPLYQ